MTNKIRIPIIGPQRHGVKTVCKCISNKVSHGSFSNFWKNNNLYEFKTTKIDNYQFYLSEYRELNHIDCSFDSRLGLVVLNPKFYKAIRSYDFSSFSSFIKILVSLREFGLKDIVLIVSRLDKIQSISRDIFFDELTTKTKQFFKKEFDLEIIKSIPYAFNSNKKPINITEKTNSNILSWWRGGTVLAEFDKVLCSEVGRGYNWNLGLGKLIRRQKGLKWKSYSHSINDPEKTDSVRFFSVPNNKFFKNIKIETKVVNIQSHNKNETTLNFDTSDSKDKPQAGVGLILKSDDVGQHESDLIVNAIPLHDLETIVNDNNIFNVVFIGNQVRRTFKVQIETSAYRSGQLQWKKVLENNLTFKIKDLRKLKVVMAITLDKPALIDLKRNDASLSRILIFKNLKRSPLFIGHIVEIDKPELKVVASWMIDFQRRYVNEFNQYIDLIGDLRDIYHQSKSFLESILIDPSSYSYKKIKQNTTSFNEAFDTLISRYKNNFKSLSIGTFFDQRLLKHLNDEKSKILAFYKFIGSSIEDFGSGLTSSILKLIHNMEKEHRVYNKQLSNITKFPISDIYESQNRVVNDLQNKLNFHFESFEDKLNVPFFPDYKDISDVYELRRVLIEFFCEIYINSDKHSELGEKLRVDIFLSPPQYPSNRYYNILIFENGNKKGVLEKIKRADKTCSNFISKLEKLGVQIFEPKINNPGAKFQIEIPIWYNPRLRFKNLIYYLIEYTCQKVKDLDKIIEDLMKIKLAIQESDSFSDTVLAIKSITNDSFLKKLSDGVDKNKFYLDKGHAIKEINKMLEGNLVDVLQKQIKQKIPLNSNFVKLLYKVEKDNFSIFWTNRRRNQLKSLFEILLDHFADSEIESNNNLYKIHINAFDEGFNLAIKLLYYKSIYHKLINLISWLESQGIPAKIDKDSISVFFPRLFYDGTHLGDLNEF